MSGEQTQPALCLCMLCFAAPEYLGSYSLTSQASQLATKRQQSLPLGFSGSAQTRSMDPDPLTFFSNNFVGGHFGPYEELVTLTVQ